MRAYIPVIALRKLVQREPKEISETMCDGQRSMESRIIHK
jgi:hypothetical protein